MILSASRRTDIPAYYFLWFVKRLEKGYLYARNPYFKKQIHRVDLSPKNIECIVFWTKYPAQLLQNVDVFLEYNLPFYILYTITPYNREIEKNIPEKITVIETFKLLSRKLGREKLIWRYDPLILFEDFTIDKHIKSFKEIACDLESYTERCILGFLTIYKKLLKKISPLDVILPTISEKAEIALILSEIAGKHGIKLQTCAAEGLLNTSSSHLVGRCIDNEVIEKLTGKKISARKDPGQRPACRCIKSIDIGTYNTCPGGCIYCYANMDQKLAEKNLKSHNPEWSSIDGEIDGEIDGDFYTLTNLSNKNIMM